MKGSRILIDAREFVEGRLTGIGRVVEGLVKALAETDLVRELLLATGDPGALPIRADAHDKISIIELPPSFVRSEKALTELSKDDVDFFISPYPKLPLFGCHAKAVHVVHDILDLTHPAYKKRLKVYFDGWRLRRALMHADLTWYDSLWSQKETQKYAGRIGKRPRVRYPAIGESFVPRKTGADCRMLKKYGLDPEYVLIIGNGLPHKNLGVLLAATDQISRRIVFVGVGEKNRRYWKSRFLRESATWISHADDGDLPSLLRNSFCLAQPSTAEGYGYPPLEAMACGIPTVVSKIPVLLETTGSVSLYADPRDPRSWIESFSALEDNEIYDIQVEKGLKWVEPLKGRKGWQGHLSDIGELLEERS